MQIDRSMSNVPEDDEVECEEVAHIEHHAGGHVTRAGPREFDREVISAAGKLSRDRHLRW